MEGRGSMEERGKYRAGGESMEGRGSMEGRRSMEGKEELGGGVGRRRDFKRISQGTQKFDKIPKLIFKSSSFNFSSLDFRRKPIVLRRSEAQSF